MQAEHTFQRDKNSSALINTDENGLLFYQEQRRKAKSAAMHQKDTNERLSSLESQISEIHSMLSQLIGNK
jgi:hypothetical protein